MNHLLKGVAVQERAGTKYIQARTQSKTIEQKLEREATVRTIRHQQEAPNALRNDLWASIGSSLRPQEPQNKHLKFAQEGCKCSAVNRRAHNDSTTATLLH